MIASPDSVELATWGDVQVGDMLYHPPDVSPADWIHDNCKPDPDGAYRLYATNVERRDSAVVIYWSNWGRLPGHYEPDTGPDNPWQLLRAYPVIEEVPF